MVNFSFPPESEPDAPVDYETLNPKNLEKVSRAEIFPAGRRIIDSNTFLLELEEEEVLRSRRLFDGDTTYEAFREKYEQSSSINEEFSRLLREDYHGLSEIQRDIARLNQLIESAEVGKFYTPEMLTSLRALKHELYGSNVSDLDEKAAHLNDIVDASELELWVVARKNFRNKDAVAAQLKGAGVVDLGKGKTLRPIVMDKNGKIGTFPRVYIADPRLHTPVSADKL